MRYNVTLLIFLNKVVSSRRVIASSGYLRRLLKPVVPLIVSLDLIRSVGELVPEMINEMPVVLDLLLAVLAFYDLLNQLEYLLLVAQIVLL